MFETHLALDSYHRTSVVLNITMYITLLFLFVAGRSLTSFIVSHNSITI